LIQRPDRRSVAAVAAAAALVAAGLLAPAALAASASPKPVPGSIAVGATTADPLGGAPWAVRTWRARLGGRSGDGPVARCLQVGRLAGKRLVRRRGERPQRPLRVGERSACAVPGDLADFGGEFFPQPPLLIERLVDDPTAREPVLARTLVAGVAPAVAREVELTALGVRQVPAIESRTRTYVAVLDGRVRRRDLVLRMRGDGRTQTLDFGTGGGFVPGSERHALTLPDPRGGRPLTLTTYEQEVRTVDGPRRMPCSEPGRLVAGEAGPYEPSWGSFLDAPTLVQLPMLEDAWPPVAHPAFTIGSCLYAAEPPLRVTGALGVKRMARGQVVVHGFMGPEVERLEVLAPDGSRAEVAVAAEEPRAFLAAVRSRGVREERIRVIAALRDGRRRRGALFTGRHAVPDAWERYETRGRGRLLRVRWIGGFEPFAHLELRERRRRVTVTVHELFPPDFAPAGASYVSADIGIAKCVEVRLGRPLGKRPVIDGHARERRRAERGGSWPKRCRRVTPRRR
jgi:hypothetical protein